MGGVSPNTLIALIGLLVAVIANTLAVFRYVAGMRDTLTEKIFAEAAKADAKSDAVAARAEAVAHETRLLIEKVSESESKSRQEFSAAAAGSLAEMRRDGKLLEDQLNVMQREMIRRSDLTQMRQEITAAIDRQERSCNDALGKLEKRVESLLNNKDLPRIKRPDCESDASRERAMARILIIDDERSLRRMIVRILTGMGHEVFEASDGLEGLELFRKHRPTLVITDILMPQREGFQTIRDLRHETPEIAILAVSGGGRERTPMFLIDAGKVGADATLRKPFRPAELIAAVNRLLPR